MMSSSYQLGTFILWIILWPHLIVMVLYYRNRSLHPINARHPKATILTTLSFFLYATFQWAEIALDVPCEIFKWLQFLFFCLGQMAVNYRLTQLLFSYEITRNITELKDHKNITDWKPNWFTRYRHLAQNKYMFLMLALISVVYFFMFLGTTIKYPGLFSYPCNQDFASTFQFVFIGKSSVGLTYSFIIAIKMWKYPNDAFGIKNEFKLYAGTPIALGILFFILRGFIVNMKDYINFILLIFINLLPFISIVFPYLQSWKSSLHSSFTGENLGEEMGLKQLLKHPEGIRAFLDYLKSEFSSENLLFWLDVQSYKKLVHSSSHNHDFQNQFLQAQHQALQIYEKFLKFPDAPCLLNLSDEVSKVTREAVEQLTKNNGNNNDSSGTLETSSGSDERRVIVALVDRDQHTFQIFDRAEEEIYRLMAADSFYRFRRTSSYERVRSIYKNVSGSSKGSGKENHLQVITDSVGTNRDKKIVVEDEVELSTSAHFTLLRAMPSSTLLAPSTPGLEDTISSKERSVNINFDPLRLPDVAIIETPGPARPSMITEASAALASPSKVVEPIDRLA